MLSLFKARQGFKLSHQIANHSPRTISWYDSQLGAFEKFLLARTPVLDPEHLFVQNITKADIEQFISHLQGREVVYEQHEFRTPLQRKLSPYSIHAYQRTFLAFFGWAVRNRYITSNPMDSVPRVKLPKSFKPRFSETEIQQLLKSCDGQREPFATRNRAILLVLLDTGIRASELCALTLDRIDSQFRRLQISGKGMKDRVVICGARTREALWRYCHVHRPPSSATNVLFLSHLGKPLDNYKLSKILKNIGECAGVEDVHPHKFRHTAARLYLRNGGDIASLQLMLGHESMAVTSIYSRMETEDLERTHQRASPVDRLGL